MLFTVVCDKKQNGLQNDIFGKNLNYWSTVVLWQKAKIIAKCLIFGKNLNYRLTVVLWQKAKLIANCLILEEFEL